MPGITNHLFTFHRFDREVTELYISHSIRRFALAMIVIFEPIYLFLYFGHSLTKTLLFFGAVAGLYGLFVPFGARIMVKLGLKKAMLFSVPFIFLYYLILWNIKAFFILPFLAVAFSVLYDLFYWPAYHTDIARFSQREFRGEQLSVGTIIYSLSSVAGPFIGGLIIIKLGFPVLFMVVLILLLVSAFPLFFSREIHEVYGDSYERAFRGIFRRENRKDSVAFAAFGIEQGVDMFIWPIFMFIIAINYEAMGFITSAALVLSLLFTLYIGKMADRIGRERLLKIGSILASVAWVFKTFVRTTFDAFLAHTIYRFAFCSANLPFRAIMYDKASADKRKLDRFIVQREMSHNLGRGFMFIILAIIFLFVSVSKIYLLFPLAAVLALFLMLLGNSQQHDQPQHQILQEIPSAKRSPQERPIRPRVSREK